MQPKKQKKIDKEDQSVNKASRIAVKIYKEICTRLGKNVNGNIVSCMTNTDIILKIDMLNPSEIGIMKVFLESHDFEKIVIYGEYIDQPNGYEEKSAQKPKSFDRSISSIASPSRKSSTAKSPKNVKEKDQKANKKEKQLVETLNLLCSLFEFHLQTTQKLEVLKFTGLRFSREGLKSLGNGLKNNHTIKEFYVTYCGLTTRDFEQVCNPLAENNNINLLDLSHNNFDDEAGRMLASILSRHGQKRDEIIWVYSIRGDKPEEDVEMKGLCDLNLSYNQLGSKALKDLASYLKHDTWIRNLNLRGNRITNDGIFDLGQAMILNSSLFSIDLRDNHFATSDLSRAIVAKLQENIHNYKQKNLMMTVITGDQAIEENEEFAQDFHQNNPNIQIIDSNPFQNSQLQEIDRNNFVVEEQPEEIHTDEQAPDEYDNPEVYMNYDGLAPIEEENLSTSPPKKEVVSKFKKNRRAFARSAGRIPKNNVQPQPQVQPFEQEMQCHNCKELEKRLLMNESKVLNLLLENYKLKKNNLMMQAQSISAINPAIVPEENNQMNIHGESISQELGRRNDQNSEEIINKIENLMSELTRMMDNLENMTATNNFTGHFENTTSLTGNQTVQLMNSANAINFNTTFTNILNSNNNSRINAPTNITHGNHIAGNNISKSSSNTKLIHDKSDSKGASQFILLHNENSQHD